jgi:polyisoprenoid-binding protein YceI
MAYDDINAIPTSGHAYMTYLIRPNTLTTSASLPNTPSRRSAAALLMLPLLPLLLSACAPVRETPATPQPPATAPAPAATPAPRPATPATPAPPVRTPGTATPPAAKPPAAPAHPADPLSTFTVAGIKQLQIDTQQSLIAITVRRGGAFARFGHDHVVASHGIRGQVDLAAISTDFQFRLDELTVDEAELRRIAGLDTQPSADAIAGTRNNMLVKVLDAQRYPVVQVHASRPAPGAPLQAAITLHGVTRTFPLPATLRAENGKLLVDGTLTLRQTDFGLVPYSVIGGAIAVQDQLELRFSIVAKPMVLH